MNHVAKRTEGFTLIELSLAMTFISVLLLAIAMTIIQVGTIYNKGTILKEINQSGRAVADDIQRTAAESASLNLTTDYVTTTQSATPSVITGGRLCFGTYSYIWNYARAIEKNDGSNKMNVTKFQSDPTREIHLLKVPDVARIYCTKNASGVLTYKTIRADNTAAKITDTSAAKELVASGDHALGINLFSMPAAQSTTDPTTREGLFNLSYAIGSGSTDAMATDQLSCLPDVDLTYCSVQQFSIVLRTGKN